jgi:hypothetical protein
VIIGSLRALRESQEAFRRCGRVACHPCVERALAKIPTGARLAISPTAAFNRRLFACPKILTRLTRHRPPSCSPTVDLFNIDAFQMPLQLMQTHVCHNSAPKLAMFPVLSQGSGWSGPSPRPCLDMSDEDRLSLAVTCRLDSRSPPSSSATADHRFSPCLFLP